MRRLITPNRTRDALYARLHEIQDAAISEGDYDTRHVHFNDRQFGPPFEDWLAVVALG